MQARQHLAHSLLLMVAQRMVSSLFFNLLELRGASIVAGKRQLKREINKIMQFGEEFVYYNNNNNNKSNTLPLPSMFICK
jgi:hypothetical protein